MIRATPVSQVSSEGPSLTCVMGQDHRPSRHRHRPPTGRAGHPSGKTLTILNPAGGHSSGVVIDGQWASRVIRVEPGSNLTLEGLTISHGSALGDYGGGILNQGTLSLVDSTISENSSAGGSGGGIYNVGTVTLNDRSSINGNWAAGGGGISNGPGSVTLNDSSSISGNTAGSYGGGIAGGSVTLNHAGNAGEKCSVFSRRRHAAAWTARLMKGVS